MLAGELNREYSVLKSSLGESMNAPPIMGNCKEKRQNESVLPSGDHTPRVDQLNRPARKCNSQGTNAHFNA